LPIFKAMSLGVDLPLPIAKERHSAAQPGRTQMEAMLGFAGVMVVTLLALFTALALQSLLLQGMLRLMQPATAHRRPVRVAIAHGAQLVVRALETHR